MEALKESKKAIKTQKEAEHNYLEYYDKLEFKREK